ncbi:MAG: hypothetical protein Q4B90_04340 [Eubacteriales bacterium]|nr:hypothetical protein [Eubacteriales bacterium]
MKSKVWKDLAMIQISDFLGLGKIKHSRDKKTIRNALLLLITYLAVGAIFLIYSFGFGKLYIDQGLGNVVLPLLFTMSSLAVLFTSLFKTNSYLIGAKDYELLQALPIPAGTIVSCRLLVSYCIECLFGAALLLPTGIYYRITFGEPVRFYLLLILAILFLPVFPIIISAVLGALLTAVSSRFRHKNIVMILGSVLLLVGIFFFSFRLPQIAVQDFQSMNEALLAGIFQIYPLTQLFFESVCLGMMSSTLLYLGISILCMILFSFIMQKTYQFLNTSLMAHRVRADYKIRNLKNRSVFQALFRKEWKRYLASPLYVTNTAVGYLLMIILSVFLCFSGADAIETFITIPGISDIVVLALPFVLATLSAMCCSTAASISIEGKNFWQMVTLPVKPSKIYNSKRAINLVLAIPAILISGIFIAVRIPLNAVSTFFLFAIPLAYTLLITELGLILNILFPKFDWKNETAIVKQGLPVCICVFGGMALGMVPIFLISALPESFRSLISPAVTLILLLAAFLLHLHTNKIELLQISE